MNINGFEIIAHRARLDKPNHFADNSIKAIKECLNYGISVEIDVWFDSGWYLGHEKPEGTAQDGLRRINFLADENNFLMFNPKIYWHAKDLKTYHQLLTSNKFACHFFYHDIEDFAVIHDVNFVQDSEYRKHEKITNRFWSANEDSINNILESTLKKQIILVSNDVNREIGYGGICTDYPLATFNKLIGYEK